MATRRVCETPTDDALLDELLGKNVVIRAVTYHYVGTLVAYDANWLRLEPACWLASSGQYWSTRLAEGDFAEVEPYPDACLVSRGAIVDMTEFRHEVPRERQ